MGHMLEMQEEYDKALEYYTRALEKTISVFNLHNDRARVNLQLGNLKKFIDDALSYFMFDDDVESSLFDLFLYMDDADFLSVSIIPF